MAREHLLDDEMLALVAEYARYSKHSKDLYEALGVGESTWYRWLSEADMTKEEVKANKVTNIKRKRELRETLKRARAQGRLDRLRRIEEAGKGITLTETTETVEVAASGATKTTTVTKTKVARHWAADAWWMERNHRDDYGATAPKAGGIDKLEVVFLTDDDEDTNFVPDEEEEG